MADGRTTQATRGTRAWAARHARRLRRAWAVVGTFLLALPLVLVPAVPASAATWSIGKEATTPGPYSPGQLVTYEVQISCSDPSTACQSTVFTDDLPDGLQLVSAEIISQPSGTTGNLTADTTGDVVTATWPSFTNGQQATISITVQIDPDLPYSANGVPITNTASVVADNAPQNTADATITPDVELVLGSETTKTIVPEGALAAPGTPATMTIGATNTSNDPVDTLVVQDPVDPTADPNPFTYLEYVSTGDVTLPPNATTVTEEYWDGDSWEPLDDTVDPATVQGVRYTFSGDIQPGATASVPVDVQQSDTVEDLTEPTTITNDTSSYVTHPQGESEPTTADDTYVVTPPDTGVTASKSFDPATVSAGDPTTVTIGATNTGTPVDTLTVTEPAPGTTNPFEGDDPLTFTGFGPTGDGTGVQWPSGASGATVTFTCADGSTPEIDAAAPNTLPNPPDGCVVLGFTVVFTGDLPNGATTSIPFTADTDPDQDVEDVTHPNTVEATVPSADPADSTANLVTLVDRLATTTDKLISPSTIPAIPGQSVIVQLPTQLLPFGPDGSTTNADQIVISDPTDPTTPNEWSDSFVPTQVRSTDVPAGSTLTINYWDGTAWVPAPGCGPYTGPDTVTCDLPGDAEGVQFVYDSTDGGFPPGTSFQPNFVAEYTGATDRDDPIENCGASSATSSTVPATPPAEGCDTVDPFPVDGEGDLDLIDKTFLGGDPPSVLARSDDQVTAQITWSTNGFSGVNPLVLSDVADAVAADDPAIAGSFYEAFDLVRVEAIDATLDPLMQYDQIESVELFIDGAWVPASDDPCPEACDGGFPGYTLSADEQESATSVRLTYTESPSRSATPSDPTTPAVGDGVARSTLSSGRHLDLTFEVRDYKRSDGSPVLGSTNGTIYNLPDDAGLVRDTARATGTFGGEDYTDTDFDDVLIIDQPLNVTVAKDWTGGPISVPPAGTPAQFYPTTDVVVTATNASAAKVDQLRIVEPGAVDSNDVQTAPGTKPFDAFTLRAIDVSPPDGATSTTVLLTDAAGETATFTEAEAEALSVGELADVVGVVVEFDGLVEPGASGTLDLTLQLRELDRYTGDPVTVAGYSPVPNGAVATITDPGGVPGQDDRQAYDDATMELQTAGMDMAVGKSFSPDTIVEPGTGPVTMTITGQPLGPSRSVEMVLTDDDPQFWNQYDFVGFVGAALVPPIQQVRVDAFVGGTFSGDPGSADPVTVTGGAWVLGQEQTFFELPASVDPADVQGLRFTFSRTDGSIWENPATPVQTVPMSVERREEMRSGGPVLPDLAENPPAPGETAPGAASNSVQGSTTGADLVVDPGSGELVPVSAEASADASLLYEHATNGVQIVKDFDGVVSGSLKPPNAVIPMNVAITNTGDRPVVDPVVVDDPMPADALGPLLTLADAEQPFVYALSGTDPDPTTPDLPTDAALVTVDQVGDLESLRFSFPPGSVLEPDQTYTITVLVKFRVGLAPNTLVANTAGVTGDRPWDECVTRLDEETGACEADADVRPTETAVIAQSKFVKATNDDELDVFVDPDYTGEPVVCEPDAEGFYSYPCVPVIAPGHDETWHVRVDNVGNNPFTKIVGYDKFPTPGDTGSYDTSPRGSAWQPVLRADQPPTLVNAPPGTQVQFSYTTADALCNDDIEDPLNEPICPADAETGWQPYVPGVPVTNPEEITAIKFVVTFPEDQPFEPGEFVAVEATSTTPPQVPAAGDRSIAWNSAAVSAAYERSDGTMHNLLPTEGQKVGVATASGPLEVNKVVTGEGAQYAPDSFSLFVQCTSAVGSWLETPLDPIPVTVVPGTPTVVPNLPYGAECTITEDGSNGETQLLVGTVTIDSEDPENPVSITATNVYELSSIEISKEVVTDAVDQDGNPVPFGPFAVDVACTFLGEDVYADGYDAENPMTDIPIEDGETIELTGLPVGSVCTVTESGTGNASSVTITVDQGLPGHPVTTEGPTTDVTLTPDVLGVGTNDVTLTNTYDVGAIGLQKVVTGEGGPAYGQGPFTISVVCTYDDDGDGPGEPRTVYDGEVVLGGAGPLDAQIANLPTGAVCDVEETDDGGATNPDEDVVVVPDTVTVGSGDVANVVITNTFDVGSIQVDKELAGIGALYGPGPFEVTLACTYEGVELTVPGGAVREIDGGASVVYDGLPVGAVCSLTETDDFGASSTAIVVDGGEPVAGTTVDGIVVPPADQGAPTTVTVQVTNTFLTAPLVVRKVVDGDAAGFAPPMPELPPLPEVPDGPIDPADLPALLEQLEQYLSSVPFEEFPYAVTLECTTNQGAPVTVIPGGPDRRFGPGFPALYFGLQDGDTCTVTETEQGGATDVAIAPNPVVVDGEATIQDPVELTVTNTYDAGSIEVTKVVAGDGAEAFGGGPFTVSAACTFLGEPIEVPGGAERMISGGEVAVYDGLPFGAECVVTETATGGASSTTVSTAVEGGEPGAAVVGAGPAQVTVTNVFDVGRVVVTKELAGPGASQHRGDAFVVTLACTWDVDGAATDVVIPGGAERTLSAGDDWTAVYEQVPQGAECTLAETDAGDAEAVTLSVAGTDVTVDPDDATPTSGTFTVPTGDASEVDATVTNAFRPTGGGSLPPTGAGVGALVVLAVLLTGTGALLRLRKVPGGGTVAA
ncbi:DUF5979 domain-containing protein [Cellulosimicrobium protaetiae]|uniref:DUF5979 domain-containing protein n=1 Tax=Cellulosimicrobium protaetiae TaxID=2587808 RepID=A0A6M5UD61_9MICO|nr:DUF5979 domain-containing protein [Cellulosimicrobium protaetiae]QJW35008.1 hypothetical protein FIC82_001110 [Cellulosimicrobium protaetiae]